MFAFNRIGPLKPESAPKLASEPAPKLASEPVSKPVYKLASKLAYNRFSINHLINYKSPGGCRSCN